MESEEILQKQFLVAYENCSSAGSHSLLRALKRFITSKPRYERRAPEFVREVRNKLYYVHQYNCHVAELTEKYPRSRHLDFLLMRYVQLEFDSLYRLNNDCPVDRSSEQEVEERILKLLQIVLQAAIVKNDCAGAIFKSKDMDVVLRKSIIKLLFNLNPRYLERRKLVYNLIRHLLEKIDRIKNEEYVQNIDKYLSIFTLDDPPQNFTVSGVAVTTSDYGTEEDSHSSSWDSDDSSNNFEAFNRQQHFDVFLNLNFDAAGGGGDGPPAQCTNRSTSDSRIVPSTIIITDKSATGNSSLESPAPKNNHTNSNDSNSNINNKNNCDDGSNKNKHPRLSQKQNTSVEPVLKSDKKRTLGRKALVNRPNKKSRTAPSGGVVTFEILDTDSEDEGCSSPKFMLSLQEEVKSNTGRISKRIKREVSTIIIDDPSDVVIAHNCIHNDSLSITDEIKEEMSNCSQQSMPVMAHEIIDLSSSSSDSESDEDIDSVQRQEFEPPPSISSNSLRSEVQSEVDQTEEITVKTEGENNREEITSSDARNDVLPTILENEVEMRSASDSVKEEEEEEGEIEKERTTASDAVNDVLPTNLEGNVENRSASGCVKEEAVGSPPPLSSNGMNSEEPQGNLLDLLLGDGRMPQGLNRKVYSRKPDSAKKRKNDSVSDMKSAQTVGVMNTDASSTKGLHCVDIANLMEPPPPQHSSLDLDLIPGDSENDSEFGRRTCTAYKMEDSALYQIF